MHTVNRSESAVEKGKEEQFIEEKCDANIVVNDNAIKTHSLPLRNGQMALAVEIFINSVKVRSKTHV
ncbi:hypothetical protein SESBI_04072 [Sesbania bispinosa]|nr:hypothetical protein SESBI_04072 [Sesbania bispinosa]